MKKLWFFFGGVGTVCGVVVFFRKLLVHIFFDVLPILHFQWGGGQAFPLTPVGINPMLWVESQY